MTNTPEHQPTRSRFDLSPLRYLLTIVAILLVINISLVRSQEKPAPRVLEAEQIVLRGPDGKIRAQLSVNEDNTVHFVLKDAESKVDALEFAVGKDGTGGFALRDQKNKVRLSAELEGSGLPHFVLTNQEDEVVAVLALWSEGDTPYLAFYDKDGKQTRIQLAVLPDATVQCSLIGPNGLGSVFMGVMPEAGPQFALQDGQEKVIYQAP